MAGRYVRVTTTTQTGDTHTEGMTFAPGEDIAGKLKGWLDWALINATDEFEIHIAPDHA